MDTGRLGVVRRQENSRRKFVFMLNEVMRSQYEVVDGYLSREKFEIGVKYDKSFVPMRRTVVKQRVLQQCLKMKRQSKIMSNRNLGAYGGKPLYTFQRDIDKLIAEMHPKLRRLKQAEKALQEGIERGRIIDPKVVPKRIDQYFEKNWKEKEVKSTRLPKLVSTDRPKDIFQNTRNNVIPPIRGLLNPFRNQHVRSVSENDTECLENRTVPEYVTKDTEPELQTQSNKRNKNENKAESKTLSEKEHSSELKREGTKGRLILPPIQQTKEMAIR